VKQPVRRDSNSKQEHAKRVKHVKAILGPEASVKAAVGSMMAREVRAASRSTYPHEPTNKREKLAVARVARELHRLNSALNHADLPKFARQLFPSDFLERQKELQAELQALGSLPLAKPKRSSEMRRMAAETAAMLMQENDLPLTTTRRGKFHRLAAALYGDDHADLFNHCRSCLGVNFID
jgi:hypothetical protein